jgi:acyl-CoA oxidase
LSDSFWKLHADPIIWRDGATGTLLTIHFNLCLGTILDFGRRRKDLTPLIDDLLAFRTKCVAAARDISGVF